MNDEAQARIDDPATFVRRRTPAPLPVVASQSPATRASPTSALATASGTTLGNGSFSTPTDPPTGGLSEPAPAANDTRATATAQSSGYSRNSSVGNPPAQPPSSERGEPGNEPAAATASTSTPAPPSRTRIGSDCSSSSDVFGVCPTCNGKTINGLAVVQHGGSSNRRNNKRKAKSSSKPTDLPKTKVRVRTVADRTKPRARLSLGQKLEVLDLLSEKKMTKSEIAAAYGCSHRTVSSCNASRATLEAEAASAARTLKSKGRRPAGFPEVDRRVLTLIEAFRKNQIPVGRTTITSFARVIKANLLASPGTAEEKKKLEKFGASDKWVKNFVSRSGLVSRPLLLKDGGVIDSELLQENVKEVQEEFKQYDLTNILSFDENGLLPKRSYISPSEAQSMEPADNNGAESLSNSGT